MKGVSIDSPIRGVMRRLEVIQNVSTLAREEALDLQDCIQDLMQLAKRYEPIVKAEKGNRVKNKRM